MRSVQDAAIRVDGWMDGWMVKMSQRFGHIVRWSNGAERWIHFRVGHRCQTANKIAKI